MPSVQVSFVLLLHQELLLAARKRTLKRNTKSAQIGKVFFKNYIFVDFAVIGSLLEEKMKVKVRRFKFRAKTPGPMSQFGVAGFKVFFRILVVVAH